MSTTKKPSLGTPLDSLLGAAMLDEAEQPATSSLQQVAVDCLRPSPYQPRKNISIEALNELTQSVRAQGIIQPIVTRKVGNNKYEIIAGERRWRAAQQAGLKEVPIVVHDVTDEAALAMALIENLQREDLNPLEEALALNRLLNEFGATHQEIADKIGKSRTTVTNLLRLLTLRSEVKTMLEHEEIEMGHARALLSLSGQKQLEVAQRVVDKNLSVRQAEALVRDMELNPITITAAYAPMDPDVLILQNRLSETLGTVVTIAHGRRGKGRLVIQYNSIDELEGILAHIK